MTDSKILLLACLALLACLPVILAGSGKYSKEKNQQKPKQERIKMDNEEVPTRPSGPFRMAKLNAVWEKAQKKLNADALRKLLDELQTQDKEEVTLKRLVNEGGDKDGSVAEELRNRLHMLLEKYGLVKGMKPDDSSVKSKNSKRETKSMDKESAKTKRLTFKDKKLNKLWEKAQRAGFSEAELENLKTEFAHHQGKLDEYYEIYEEKIADGDKKKEKDEDTENKILDQWNDLSSELSADELEDQVPTPVLAPVDDAVKLDTKLKQITKGYNELKNRVNRNSPEGEEADFTENRVEELWHQAIAAGFNRYELSSLREELRHFEQKLKKLKHLNDQIQTGGKKIQEDMTGKNTDRSNERVDLETKAKHFAQRTNNIEKELERKIASKHNEL